MNQKNERSHQEWEKLQNAAQSKIGVLYSQLKEIDRQIHELWGNKKIALEKERDKIIQLLDRQPDLVAEYAYKKVLAYLGDLAKEAAPIKAALDEITPKYKELVSKLARIEKEIREEVEREFARQPIPEMRDMYGNPAGRPDELATRKRKEGIEKTIDARFTKQKVIFEEENNFNEIDSIHFDLSKKLEVLAEQARVYGEDIELIDPKTLQAAARRHALAALRGAENCRRAYLSGAFDR